jgi:hypothetical protein
MMFLLKWSKHLEQRAFAALVHRHSWLKFLAQFRAGYVATPIGVNDMKEA